MRGTFIKQNFQTETVSANFVRDCIHVMSYKWTYFKKSFSFVVQLQQKAAPHHYDRNSSV